MLWEHTPAATVPYLGLGAEISLVGYVLKTPPVGILDVPFFFNSFGIYFFVVLISRVAFFCCALAPGTLALELPTLIL